MYIKTYLPDDLGQRAKDAGINFSALLREAVERELPTRTAAQSALAHLAEHAPRGALSMLSLAAEGIGEPIPQTTHETTLLDGSPRIQRVPAHWRDVTVAIALDGEPVDAAVVVGDHDDDALVAPVYLVSDEGILDIGAVSLLVDDPQPSYAIRLGTLARDLSIDLPGYERVSG